MGFEINAAALLLKMRRDGIALGRVLTLGHQHLHLSAVSYQRLLAHARASLPTVAPVFADDVLCALGATSVESLDTSAYEGATRLHDLNAPVPEAWHAQFDLVFDGGTLEHVFNVTVALESCMRMLKPGGRFVSVTVPNNWCGHGFYQFSPELFFRAFSAENGFSTVEIYFADVAGRRYHRVLDPAAVRSRVQLRSCDPMFLLVHARRDEVRPIFAAPPQQSDYVGDWKDGTQMNGMRGEPSWKSWPVLKPIRRMRAAQLRRRHRRLFSLENRAFYQPADLRF